ncbi:hypothetical protein LCGC14_2698730, partial [marine sediment metagenome]
FKEVSPRGSVFYRIYRSAGPITAANLPAAELLDEIWPLSGYDGRMHEHLTRGEDWMGLNPANDVPRYCIERPPGGVLSAKGAKPWHGKGLPLHTGLYVHRPAKAGKGYYAVTVLSGGVENTVNIGPGNSLARPVTETIGAGEPILYRVMDQTHKRGRRVQIRETQFFVYWAAPPYANQPRRPIHIMVGLAGAKPSGKLITEYNVGDMYGSEIIRGTHVHAWKDAAFVFRVICDGSFGNKGYWSSWNTLLSREQAKNEPYAERMAKLFTPWVRKLPKRVAAE